MVQKSQPGHVRPLRFAALNAAPVGAFLAIVAYWAGANLERVFLIGIMALVISFVLFLYAYDTGAADQIAESNREDLLASEPQRLAQEARDEAEAVAWDDAFDTAEGDSQSRIEAANRAVREMAAREADGRAP